MKLKLIRNATLQLTYGGHRFLIDPYLGLKYSQPTFAGKSPNPTVELPCPAEDVIKGMEMVIISHNHPDHFDETAQKLLPKDTLIYCQPIDADVITNAGFHQVIPIEDAVKWEGISITRTTGQHGTGERGQMMGPVSGFVFKHPDEPVVYWMGDTIWNSDVQQIIATYHPHIIVTHSAGAIWRAGEAPVIMDAGQTVAVCQFAPDSTVIATHMDALDLVTVSRHDLRAWANKEHISPQQLLIPEDGEELQLGIQHSGQRATYESAYSN